MALAGNSHQRGSMPLGAVIICNNCVDRGHPKQGGTNKLLIQQSLLFFFGARESTQVLSAISRPCLGKRVPALGRIATFAWAKELRVPPIFDGFPSFFLPPRSLVPPMICASSPSWAQREQDGWRCKNVCGGAKALAEVVTFFCDLGQDDGSQSDTRQRKSARSETRKGFLRAPA